jgi:hypothetical protein
LIEVGDAASVPGVDEDGDSEDGFGDARLAAVETGVPVAFVTAITPGSFADSSASRMA